MDKLLIHSIKKVVESNAEAREQADFLSSSTTAIALRKHISHTNTLLEEILTGLENKEAEKFFKKKKL